MKKLGDLKHNPKNPRHITEGKLLLLKKSMDEFGDLSGIVFNVRSGQLVGGHQRQKVLSPDSKINLTESYLEPTSVGTVAVGHVIIDGEKFNYREVDWDDNKEKAANIAANKGAGEWDYPQLTDWMKELKDADYDLDNTMFDSDERDRLLGGWETDDTVADTDENLDGIMALIKIKCPQEIKDEVLIYIKSKILETSFEGVEVV